ncbi:hypothetical protein ZIOFF_008044 [Zingiber officinale]|uniref:HAT C-terminal dimerisation domain-containing protein n=1 Tax=Zingiber officinale TaxID=94328 RepID=A0A8J5I2N5_ZINOF|nr:hypothetical protein ZIOFF_008044 [Zingiber officinale]
MTSPFSFIHIHDAAQLLPSPPPMAVTSPSPPPTAAGISHETNLKSLPLPSPPPSLLLPPPPPMATGNRTLRRHPSKAVKLFLHGLSPKTPPPAKLFLSFISSFMNVSSESGSSPSTTQPHTDTVSPSKTSIIHEKVVDIGGKRKKVADVWSHAKKIIRRNDKNEVTAVVAICNYCKIEVPAHSKTHGNNGIDGHVKKCKKNPHNAMKLGSSQSILTQSSMNNALTPHILCQKKLEDKVVAFVVKDEMPFRVVEGAGFVEMMKEAQPRFKIPNRKKIASLNINYMVIIAHFLDNDWKLHKRIINFTKITSHKGDDIDKVLETCLSNWGTDKVFTTTVDNASTNDKAVEYMEKRLKEMGTLLFDVEPIRNCAKYIHSFGARLDQFRECAILLKMDKMSTVPMDVPTRWNSTYTMLSVAYAFKKVFGRIVENVQFIEYFEEVNGSEKKKRVGPPMEKYWEKAQVFVNFLKRFHDTTLQLSATKKTTSSLIWEKIVVMRMIINETILDTTNPSLQEVAKRMESKFKKYWGNLEKIAKDIFSIPSSTVASENAFSLGRRVVDPFRASLHPKMVEALMCISDWLRGEEINLYKEPTEDEFNFYKDCEEVVTSTLIA